MCAETHLDRGRLRTAAVPGWKETEVSYFVAVLARDQKEWSAVDLDVNAAGDLESLTESLRMVDVDGPVLVFVEQEDEWFGLIRVDEDDDPHVFISDPGAASATPYAERLGVEVTDEELGDQAIGDFELLADLGTSPAQLRGLCDGEQAVTTGEALTAIAEAAGFDELLDSLR